MDVTDRLPDAIPFIGREEAAPEPFLERAARWASQLTYRDVPRPVRRSAKAQLTSNVAAALWTRSHPLGTRIGEAVRTQSDDGSATCLSGARTTPENAAYGNAALSTALGVDGAILGGYVGRSSVFVPLAYAESADASGRRLLLAQIAANEIAGRLGAATAIGPFDEERTAYIHAVGAAVGRSVVEDDDAEVFADAIGTALSQPPWPLERSILGSEAEIWSASEPIRNGIAAVDSARSGISGRRDLIEGDGGFFSTVSARPAPEYLSEMGDRWHTRTLTVKQFPSSMSVAAPIEAALEVRGRFDRGRTSVGRVDVHVPNAAIEAAARAEAYSDGRNSSSAMLLRSLSHNVAVALVDGERTPERLDRKRDDVRTMTERVTIHHDPELTVTAARSAGQSGVTLGGGGRSAPLRAARTIGPKAALRHLPTVLRAGRTRSPPTVMEDAERRFGSRVVVTTADGRTIDATIDRPSGFAGAPPAEKRAVARTKCRRAMEALDVDAPTARRHAETLLAIDESDPVSFASILEAIDEQ